MSLTATLLLIFVPAATFATVHGLTRKWWKSAEGSALVFSASGWALVSGAFLLDMHVSDVSDAAWLCIATLAAASQWLKVWILFRARRDRVAASR